MRLNLSRILLIAMLLTGFAQYAFALKDLNITGYAPKLEDGTKIYFLPTYTRRYLEKERADRKTVKEKYSITVRQGRFSSVLGVRNGDTYTIEITGIKGSKKICLSEGVLQIELPGRNLDSITFKGNETTIEYDRFYKNYFGSEIYKAAARARIEAKISNYPNVRTLSEKLLDSNGRFVRKAATEHLERFPNSYINTYLLYSSGFTETQKKELFSKFSKNLKDNTYGDNLRFDIDSLFIGGYAPSISQTDTTGKLVRLSDYKGNYIFLDFWASWCVPCRAENPYLVEAMKAFGNKNFNIIGISLDDDRNSWTEAIKADKLNWIHVSDLKKYNNKVSVNYDVYSIPANFLLDGNGKIVAKNLRGKELLEILNKIYK